MAKRSKRFQKISRRGGAASEMTADAQPDRGVLDLMTACHLGLASQ